MKAQLRPSERLLVAVSGGGDSVALLHLVLPPEAERKRLVVAAVHHGDESHGSEVLRFVRKTCRELGVTCKALYVTIDPEQKKDLGYEAAARQVRYEALEEVGEKLNCGLWLTAHTLDDRAEGVLLGLLRGGDVGALANVRSWRGRWHRPLLPVSREQLREFLKSNGVAWLEDPYNDVERFSRVRVRQHIAPTIREQFGDVGWEAIAASAARLEQAEQALEELARQALAEVTDGSTPRWIAIETQRLRGYVEHVRSRVLLAAWAHAASVDPASAYLPRKTRTRFAGLLMGEGGGRSLQAGNVRVTASGNRLIFDGLSAETQAEWTLPGRLKLPDGAALRAASVRGGASLSTKAEPGIVEYINEGSVQGPLTVRPWRAGDRWAPLDRRGREVKVVRSLRRPPGSRIGVLWVVLDRDGEIIWIPGERIAHSCRLTERTQRAWKLVWTPPVQEKRADEGSRT